MSRCKRCPLAEPLRGAMEAMNEYRVAADENMDAWRMKNAEAEDMKAERDTIASELATRDKECEDLRARVFRAEEALRARDAELGEAYDKLDSATEQLNAAHEVIRQMEEKREVQGGGHNTRPGIAWRPGREPGVWVKESAPEERDKQLREAEFEM